MGVDEGALRGGGAPLVGDAETEAREFEQARGGRHPAALHPAECPAEMMRAIETMQAKAKPDYLAKLSRDYRRIAYDVQTSSWIKTSVPRV